MTQSAYIHIPFCKQKCKYCSFVSFPAIEKKQDYLRALQKEINYFYKGETLATIYFGGGTPSLLEAEEFKVILDNFQYQKDTEITAELNPETLTLEYLHDLKKIGINRISIGCQTFDDNVLKIIGRRHTAKQVETTVKWAQAAGFDNISIDFIYGLPMQTVNNFASDLKKAVALGIQHISLYGLKIDEGCFFYNNIPKNLPDNDTQADMYLKAIEILKDFNHYEVSNFGKPSRHNLNYWNNENYYGFGTAAHGYTDNTRYANFNTLDEYIQNPLKHKSKIKLTKQDQLEEEIFLGFRRMDGINTDKINAKYNIDFEKKYKSIFKKYNDFFVKTDLGYALNIEGVLISNDILCEFLQ